jgi:hypothetical protein
MQRNIPNHCPKGYFLNVQRLLTVPLPNTDNCANSVPQWQPEICGRLGQTNNLAPLQTDVLETLPAYDTVGKRFKRRVPKLRIYCEDILSRVET